MTKDCFSGGSESGGSTSAISIIVPLGEVNSVAPSENSFGFWQKILNFPGSPEALQSSLRFTP